MKIFTLTPGVFRSAALASFSVLAFSFVAGGLQAQKPNARRPFEIVPAAEDHSIVSSTGRFDAVTGAPLALYYLNEYAEGATPQDKARNWLLTNARRMSLQHADLSDISLRTERNAQSGSNVRFTQNVHGIPVYNSEIVVNLDPGGFVRLVFSDYKPNVKEELPAAVLTASEARDLAINWIGLTGPYQVDRTRQVVYVWEGETYLAYEVRLVGDAPIGDWEAIVDASSGAFLRVEDKSCYHHADGGGEPERSEPEAAPADFPACSAYMPLLPVATGTGNVFDADPLSSANAAYGGSYVDGSDANAAVLTAQIFSRTLNSITLTGSTYSLVGPYADIRDFEAPSKGLFTQASSTFAFDRNADAFEAVNTYYHIDKSMRYLNLTLGITCMPYQYAGGVQFDPSGLSGADNSHYLGGSGRIAFGEGGVDDAEDVDVIIHELGHGLHDWITSGGLSNVQGLSEGTGDYWAMSYSRSLGQWPIANAAYHWVFNWDGHNPFWGGRTTNYGAVYPGGLTGAIHTDGQIWSTCMMKVWDAIGKTNADRALWTGLAMTGGSATQNDAAIAVRQAAINMSYSAADVSTISTLLSGCGYTLPVILAVNMDQFDASRISPSQVALNWSTASEENHDRFVIERRLSHETRFTDVGEVLSNGNTRSFMGYAFTDPNAFQGTSYYRLRLIDINGNEDWTEVAAVNGAKPEGFFTSVWPNPSEGCMNIEVLQAEHELKDIHVTVSDLAGREVVSMVHEAKEAVTVISPDMGAIAPGVYVVSVTAGENREVMRWVKR